MVHVRGSLLAPMMEGRANYIITETASLTSNLLLPLLSSLEATCERGGEGRQGLCLTASN